MTHQKVIELAKKIKALADRGIDGEQRNAAELLDYFLEKHGLSMDDIESETRVDMHFVCQKKQRQMMKQIFLKVLGIDAQIYGVEQKRYDFIVECTPAEKIEIVAMFKFHWAAYQRELAHFERAFIMRHRLYPDDGEGRNYDDLTQEEKDDFDRAHNLAQGIEKSDYFKQIKG